jgi:hypothetical protein
MKEEKKPRRRPRPAPPPPRVVLVPVRDDPHAVERLRRALELLLKAGSDA